MKMFLTRLGFNSKAVITGDTTQIDLPQGKKSGLIEALEVCGKIEGIGVVQFGEKDVVRHNLVQQIIRAYEDYDVAHPQRGANAGTGAANNKAGVTAEATGNEPNRENQRA
jgi:phosphate starvation-inducible PhoH-like protein